MLLRPKRSALGGLIADSVRLASSTVRLAVSAGEFAGSAALLGGAAAVQAGTQALSVVPGVGPAARAAAGMAAEAAGGPAVRRTSRRGNRRWIEVRGLSGPDAEAIAGQVLAAVRAAPGVEHAELNHSVTRVVVTLAPGGTDRDLVRVVEEAERRARTRAAPRHRPLTLPGDDTVLVARSISAAAAAMGLGVSLVGAALRVPGLPGVVTVVPTLADNVPGVRRHIQRRLGDDGTELLFSMLNSAGAALTVSPTAAAAEAATRVMLAVESWDARQSWHRHEPGLAQHPPPHRTAAPGAAAFADGAGERYANRAGRIGLAAAVLTGALSGNPAVGGAAALVAAPKPTRSVREAFGCAMTRGLIGHHDALVLRPRALRALDRVGVIVIDPRSLYTDTLMVSRLRGVDNGRRAQAWKAASEALAAGRLTPGWHRLSSIPGTGGRGSALVSPVRDPFATAVVTEARKAGVRVVSVDDDGLRSLAQGFDTLHPIGDSLDDALSAAVAAARAGGATVALITTSDMASAHEADITIGVARGAMPPWGADVFVPDLPAVWRILRSIPAARSAVASGVRLSLSSTAIGTLMLIPGVPGYGPESVNLGALGGVWSGLRIGSGVFGDAVPAAEPSHDWHELPAEEVRRLLPRPPDEPRSSPTAAPTLLAPVRMLRRAGSSAWSLAGEFVTEMREDLADPITPILSTGAVASALLGSPLDAVLVGGVLLTNAALSAQQQLHAERVLRGLLAVQDPPAWRVVGAPDEGRTEDVPARALRPGDVIEVHAGELVPADGRLIEAVNLEVDESTLTGESLPVPKQTAATPGAALAERACMIYAGTTVVAGTARAVVTAVGRATEVRRALAMAPRSTRQIGLQRQLARVTGRALPWSLGGGALVGALSVVRGTPLREAVASAVSVTVAAVPEGLPLVATLAQAAAARKLSGEQVLIRNANSVEALARLQVVCFDKTGTLSENRLEVKRVQAMPGRTDDQVLDAALSTVPGQNGRVTHATDEAVRRAAGGRPDPRPADAHLPFQSGRPFAAALTGTRLTVKGAPEVLSARLADGPSGVEPMIARLAADGLRVLAVAERTLTARQAARAAADPEAMERLCADTLTAIGLLGIADTLRPAAAPLLSALDERGIGVRLITGDHPVTAAVIAGELGLAVTEQEVVTGTDWELLSADERVDTVTTHRVFARMSPEHKVEVVQTLEAAGLVTAMVGDGANDAAAIRAATVGVGVAAQGSDPARTAADVILLDGRIEALLEAVDEGEQLWRRVQSAVSVLLGGNLGEVVFALITSLLTGRSALNARQMLLVNMLTDALPAAALAVSSQDGPATGRDEAAMWRAIAVRGTATTVGASLAWTMGRLTGPAGRAGTIALIGLVGTQLAQTLADSQDPMVVATAAGSLLALAGIISTPGVSQIFGCTPVDPLGWGQALLATGVASVVAALAPAILSRIESALTESPAPPGDAGDAGSGRVVDDDEARDDQQGVDLPDRRGQQADTNGHQRVRSGAAKKISHTPKRTTPGGRQGSAR